LETRHRNLCKFSRIPAKLLADYKGKCSPKRREINHHKTVSSPQNRKDTGSQGKIWKIYVKCMHINAAVKG
jgi:hypothetical protein